MLPLDRLQASWTACMLTTNTTHLTYRMKYTQYVHFRLPPRCKWGLRSFWDVPQRRLVVTDASGQPSHLQVFLDCLPLEDGTHKIFPNVVNYQSTLRNIPEERRPHTQ